MHPPYPQTQQQQQQQQQMQQTQQLHMQQQQQGLQQLGPPPLQPNRFPPPMGHMNNYPKDDFRKVIFSHH